MNWVVDDSGRVSILSAHPVFLWASASDSPIKEILDLGFICIQDRSRNLIIALNTLRVRPVTLVGTFYFLAQQNVSCFTIYTNCDTEFAFRLVVFDVNTVYRLLEEMVSCGPAELPWIVNGLENRKGKQHIRYFHPIPAVERTSLSETGYKSNRL